MAAAAALHVADVRDLLRQSGTSSTTGQPV